MLMAAIAEMQTCLFLFSRVKFVFAYKINKGLYQGFI
jgi:hypothetical protein